MASPEGIWDERSQIYIQYNRDNWVVREVNHARRCRLIDSLERRKEEKKRREDKCYIAVNV